ncbi:uncharacterized protein [Pyrus communis]|uniref:uncharacterized protein n=1 Tax=Pyrus communis TaxID=23211 RepID=UPI0035C19204
MAQVFTMNAQLLRYRQQQRRQREIASLEQRTFVRLHVRREEINRITRLSDTNCLWELRMDRNAFAVLCDLLQTRGGLVDDGHVTIEEQVATFVNILAHHNKNRSMQVRFIRSSETISRYVRRVLRALLSLQEVLFAKPTPIPEDCTKSRWKCFKGCLGALDGTYIGVTVPDVDRPRYRTRKGHISTNRCFGLLKRRWAILRSPSHYPIKIQGRMITACSLLYNFIRIYMAVDPEENARLAFDELPIGEDLPEVLAYIETVESSQIWTQWRDDLAREIYDEWRGMRA